MRRELTADERAALARYIAKHGRTWKRDMHRMWIDSNPRTEDETYLYTLRNSASFGPSWLARYKPDLNAVGAAARANLDAIQARTDLDMTEQTTAPLTDLLLKTPHLREGLQLYAFIGDIRVAAYDLPDARQAAHRINQDARYLHSTTLSSYDLTPSIVLSPRLIGRLRAIEGQPALPGAENVRQAENATPAYDLPEQTSAPHFELAADAAPLDLRRTLFTQED